MKPEEKLNAKFDLTSDLKSDVKSHCDDEQPGDQLSGTCHTDDFCSVSSVSFLSRDVSAQSPQWCDIQSVFPNSERDPSGSPTIQPYGQVPLIEECIPLRRIAAFQHANT